MKDTVRILKKYNRMWLVCFSLFVAVFCLVLSFMGSSAEASIINALLSLLNIVLASNVIEGAYRQENFEMIKERLFDVSDKLCLADHEVERLQLELDTYKSAKQEAKDSPAAEPQKPKRKPAPKRKPKTETKE